MLEALQVSDSSFPDDVLTMEGGDKVVVLDDVLTMEGGEKVVVLVYQSFCDPARSTKRYVEELSEQYGFDLLRMNADLRIPPEYAGKEVPHISVYTKGVCATLPLKGAQTRSTILQYMLDEGVIVV